MPFGLSVLIEAVHLSFTYNFTQVKVKKDRYASERELYLLKDYPSQSEMLL